MTIEEAIEHAHEVAEGCPAADRQCSYQHDQLADWLEELKAYRDTGLKPKDIISAVDMARVACTLHELNAYTDLGPIDHLRELVQAEKAGRLVVLPCKVGDTVYCVYTIEHCPKTLFEEKIKTISQAVDLIGKVGKRRKVLSVYLTREEAEAALAAALKGGAEGVDEKP